MNAVFASIVLGFFIGVAMSTIWGLSIAYGGLFTGLAFLVTIISVVVTMFFLFPIIIEGIKENG